MDAGQHAEASETEPKRKRSRVTRWVAIGVIAVVFVVAGVVFVATRHRNDSTTLRRPREWPAAERTNSQATVAYLSGPGAPLMKVVDVVDTTISSSPSNADCSSVASTLDKTADPGTFLELTAQLPDPTLGELLANLSTDAHLVLSECAANASSRGLPSFDALRSAVGYVKMRRAELEAAAR